MVSRIVNTLADVGVVCRFATQPSIAVEAVEWRGDVADLPAEWLATGAFTHAGDNVLIVHTTAGPRIGDFLVRGVAGDFHPLDAARSTTSTRRCRYDLREAGRACMADGGSCGSVDEYAKDSGGISRAAAIAGRKRWDPAEWFAD